MPNMKSSVSRRVLSTVLSLVIVLAPVTATAQEVGEQNVAQLPADTTGMTRTAIDFFERPNVPASFQETLRLLRAPGWHPELMEVLGFDESGEAESLLVPGPVAPALSTKATVAIIITVVAVVLVIAIIATCEKGQSGCTPSSTR